MLEITESLFIQDILGEEVVPEVVPEGMRIQHQVHNFLQEEWVVLWEITVIAELVVPQRGVVAGELCLMQQRSVHL